MTKKTPSNKEVFTQAAQPEQEEAQDNSPKDQEERLVSDPMRYTIFGTQGGKAKLIIETEDETIEAEFTPEDPKDYPINLGTDDITLDEEKNGYRILIKQEDKPHKEGIDGGRITRLAFVKEGKAAVYYDYGRWREKPDLPIEFEMVDNILEDFNATPQKERKDPNDRSKDKGHDL